MPDLKDTPPDIDPIAAYETAIEGLKAASDDRGLQHQAVLALARAGSLQFARAEYQRYGLDKVRHHEDIMALGGRLYKDLYQSATGKTALEYARKSSELYEAAFKDTGGFYSGVNAATMALLADMPAEIVQDRAKAILNTLPDLDAQSLTQRYYIEATRAEAHVLLGELEQSEEVLRKAIAHDPLNYIAHASTLRQYRLIAQKRDESIHWLDALDPPKAAHFAGHITGEGGALTDAQVAALKIQISDHVQAEDIGFAYGALAAGSDIILAETLLEEGAALHVVLPISAADFVTHSVIPLGPEWQARFEACLSAARSVTIVSPTLPALTQAGNRFAAQVAMGQAILQAARLDSAATQLLVWDGREGGSQTAAHAADWTSSSGDQLHIDYPAPRQQAPQKITSEDLAVTVCCARSDDEDILQYENLPNAIDAARQAREENDHIQIGLDVGLPEQNTDTQQTALLLCAAAPPGSVLLSERAASLLALKDVKKYAPKYAGQIQDENGDAGRAFSL